MPGASRITRLSIKSDETEHKNDEIEHKNDEIEHKNDEIGHSRAVLRPPVRLTL